MGHFLAVSAAKGISASSLTSAIGEYADLHSVKHKLVDLPPEAWPNENMDSLVFPETSGWTVVLWPAYFNVHDFPAAEWLSTQLSTLVSTINVYDDECWAHGLFENGVEIDRFCSVPETHANSEGEVQTLRVEWKGDPSKVAAKFEVPTGSIAPYMVHLGYEPSGFSERMLSLFKRRAKGKVANDDEFEIEDFWVFTDFWRRAGIHYPDPSNYASCIRFARGWNDRLPMIE